MTKAEETISALEDLIISYSDDGGSVAHVAFRAKSEIERLGREMTRKDDQIERLTNLLKQAGVEVLA